MTLKPGMYFDVPAAEYHADPCERPSLSASIAKMLTVDQLSPAHAWEAHAKGGADDDEEVTEDDDGTPATRMGSLAHHLLLGGGAQYVRVKTRDAKTGEVREAPDYRTKGAQEHRELIKEEGKTPVIGKVYDTAVKHCDKLRGKLDIPNRTEVTIVWESDGVLCRGRLDGYEHGAGEGGYRWRGWDLKTTGKGMALRAASASNIIKYGLHIQRAAYVEGVETLFPELAGRGEWAFQFAEVGGVFGVVTRDLDAMLIEAGRREWKRAKSIWAACLASNTWPNYPEGKQLVECPPWYLAALGYEP